MRKFAALFDRLEQAGSADRKVACLAEYFNEAAGEDKLWAIALLTHKRPGRRLVAIGLLREWAAETSGLPTWLFEESCQTVGDIAETIALLSPSAAHGDGRSLYDHMRGLIALGSAKGPEKKAHIIEAWTCMTSSEKFVFNKLVTGNFRAGISDKLLVRALAIHTGQEENVLMHKITGNWDPLSATFEELILGDSAGARYSRPYPFCLSHPLEDAVQGLGGISDWMAEWIWDGIRGQLIKRRGEVFLWSKEGELISGSFPEFQMPAGLPDGLVIDGVILPFRDGRAMPFREIQKRLGKKNVRRKLLSDVPVVMMAFDLLEWRGDDIRELPLVQRRKLLEQIVAAAGHPNLILSPLVAAASWEELERERQDSRKHQAGGLMLKFKNGTYDTGRVKGDWFKWQAEALSVDAVMIYATGGSGRGAGLYTDYTFAVRDAGELVGFARVSGGLSDAETEELDLFIRENTLERFGPVRSVRPVLVFEIAFEGIARSGRHRSGLALRLPRIKRWRKDRTAQEAASIQDLQALLEIYG